MSPLQNRGAIVLCGGRSTRLGRDKATLPFGSGEVMLQRVVRLVSEVVSDDRIVCAAAPGQKLPSLPASVRKVHDRIPAGTRQRESLPGAGSGPLAGLAAGLTALRAEVDAVYATGCDVPLLVPAFVRRMFDLLGDHEIAVPHDGQRFHPLAGVYRTDVLPKVEAQLATDDWSMNSLLDRCRARRVELDQLRDVDPQLASLANSNTPDDYRRMLQCLRTLEPGG